jgi:uncharacterized protein (TIGR03067 family)
VDKQLPSRPNLDHLRRQAKSLLAALAAGDDEAVSIFLEHLPAAKGLSRAQVAKTSFRLADAQSAIARKSGFAAWPQLIRHAEQLRALEGSWAFASLEVDGVAMPAAAMATSKILIDGDRFRTESPEANYEGIFNIDVEAQPHKIDIEFIAGPEAGNWNYGIFRIERDELEICLDLNGKPSPGEFRTTPGSGLAYERLTRASQARPESVTGGMPSARQSPQPVADPAQFNYVPSPTLARLAGEWTAEKLVRDGQEFPAMLLKTGRRTARENEVQIYFGGQLIIHALVRIDEHAAPLHVDYCHIGGQTPGALQLGIMEWRDDIACFCMSPSGSERPSDFTCPAGSGRTLSCWRPKN